DGDLPVEPAGPQQRGIQDVRTVRRRDQNDPATRVEPVHLDQQLVQRLLAFVVTAADTRAPLPTDGVELVDEDNARCVVLRLFEHVAHPRSTHTDEHLHEVGTGDRVEGYTGFTGNSACQQGFTGTRWTVEQHTLRDLRPKRLIPRRLLQEVLDLVQFLDSFVGARDI